MATAQMTKQAKERLLDEKIVSIRKRNAMLENRFKQSEADKKENPIPHNFEVNDDDYFIRRASPPPSDMLNEPPKVALSQSIYRQRRIAEEDVPPPDPRRELLFDPGRDRRWHRYNEKQSSRGVGSWGGKGVDDYKGLTNEKKENNYNWGTNDYSGRNAGWGSYGASENSIADRGNNISKENNCKWSLPQKGETQNNWGSVENETSLRRPRNSPQSHVEADWGSVQCKQVVSTEQHKQNQSTGFQSVVTPVSNIDNWHGETGWGSVQCKQVVSPKQPKPIQSAGFKSVVTAVSSIDDWGETGWGSVQCKQVVSTEQPEQNQSAGFKSVVTPVSSIDNWHGETGWGSVQCKQVVSTEQPEQNQSTGFKSVVTAVSSIDDWYGETGWGSVQCKQVIYPEQPKKVQSPLFKSVVIPVASKDVNINCPPKESDIVDSPRSNLGDPTTWPDFSKPYLYVQDAFIEEEKEEVEMIMKDRKDSFKDFLVKEPKNVVSAMPPKEVNSLPKEIASAVPYGGATCSMAAPQRISPTLPKQIITEEPSKELLAAEPTNERFTEYPLNQVCAVTPPIQVLPVKPPSKYIHLRRPRTKNIAVLSQETRPSVPLNETVEIKLQSRSDEPSNEMFVAESSNEMFVAESPNEMCVAESANETLNAESANETLNAESANETLNADSPTQVLSKHVPLRRPKINYLAMLSEIASPSVPLNETTEIPFAEINLLSPSEETESPQLYNTTYAPVKPEEIISHYSTSKNICQFSPKEFLSQCPPKEDLSAVGRKDLISGISTQRMSPLQSTASVSPKISTPIKLEETLPISPPKKINSDHSPKKYPSSEANLSTQQTIFPVRQKITTVPIESSLIAGMTPRCQTNEAGFKKPFIYVPDAYLEEEKEEVARMMNDRIDRVNQLNSTGRFDLTLENFLKHYPVLTRRQQIDMVAFENPFKNMLVLDKKKRIF